MRASSGGGRAKGFVPVAVVTGFYGSGKTSLLHRLAAKLVAPSSSPLSIALLLHSLSEESVEAGWVRGRLRNVPRGRLAVEEVTGCGPDLPQRFIEALSRLARSDLYDYIFVELLGDQNPLHLAHLLTLSDARGTPLSDFLQLDAIVCVVDASRLITDAKSRLDVVRAQLAAAQVVVLNKTDLVSSQELRKVETAMRLVAHNSTDELDARVYHAVHADLAPTLLTNTGLFSYNRVMTLPSWPQQLWVPEQCMNAFVYRAQRPFQPDRLWKVASSSISHLKAVVRAKGLVWLVSRPDRWGYWSQNPQSIDISGGDAWSISSGKDKRQEILFVGGQDLDKEAISRLLDACLLKDTEATPERMATVHDPFPAWEPLSSSDSASASASTPTHTPAGAPSTRPSSTDSAALPASRQSAPSPQSPSPASMGSGGQPMARRHHANAAMEAKAKAKKAEMKDFAGALRDAAKQVVADCRALAEFVEHQSTTSLTADEDSETFDEPEEGDGEVEAQVLQLAKNLAMAATTLDQEITSHITAHPQNFGSLKEKKFLGLLQQVKDAVLSLIKASKHVVSNPRDWMTKQKVTNSLRDVGVSIKELVALADNMHTPQSVAAVVSASKAAAAGGAAGGAGNAGRPSSLDPTPGAQDATKKAAPVAAVTRASMVSAMTWPNQGPVAALGSPINSPPPSPASTPGRASARLGSGGEAGALLGPEMKNAIITETKAAALALTLVDEAVKAHSSLKFVSTSRDCVTRCKNLIQMGNDCVDILPPSLLATENDYPSPIEREGKELSELLMDFVAAGRRIFAPGADPARAAESEQAFQEIKRGLAHKIKSLSISILASIQKFEDGEASSGGNGDSRRAMSPGPSPLASRSSSSSFSAPSPASATSSPSTAPASGKQPRPISMRGPGAAAAAAPPAKPAAPTLRLASNPHHQKHMEELENLLTRVGGLGGPPGGDASTLRRTAPGGGAPASQHQQASTASEAGEDPAGRPPIPTRHSPKPPSIHAAFLQKSASVRAIAAAEEGQGLAGAAGPQPHAADPWRAGSRISLPVNFAKQEGLLNDMEAEHTQQANSRNSNSSSAISEFSRKVKEENDYLERMKTMKSYSEWRQNTIARSAHKKILNHMPDVNVGTPAEQQANIVASFGETLTFFIVSANEYVLQAQAPDLDPAALAEQANGLEASVAAVGRLLRNVVGLCMEVSGKYSAPSVFGKILNNLLTAIESIPPAGKADEQTVAAATGHYQTWILARMNEKLIFEQSSGLMLFARQALSSLRSNLFLTANSGPIILYLAAIVSTMCKKIVTLLDLTETCKLIYRHRKARENRTNSLRHHSLADAEAMLESMRDDVDIWEEEAENSSNLRRGSFQVTSAAAKDARDAASPLVAPLHSAAATGGKKEESKENNKIMAGSLNKLVEALTSDTQYDNRFLKTFITTYQSFTTPAKLFDKLLQRYNVRTDRVDASRVKAIQLRVCVVLKYWVENQFFDFDEELIQQIFDFVGGTLEQNNPDLAGMVAKELQNRILERKDKMKTMFIKPQELVAPQVSSVSALFMSMKAEDLARQLTLIEFEIYSSISGSELLGQSWNKESLQHRSPNVMALIHRANKLSFWVSTMILNEDTHKARKKIFEKFIAISDQLFKLKNFHTLMSIIAGINTSPISRLRATKKDIKGKLTKAFKRLEEIMNPQGSFSNYRNILHTSSPPCIPYLGVYLSDLTFMEDGNPDKVDNLINLGKRELIYRVIEEVNQYQVTPYQIQANEPIHTFLRELPHLEEKDLFDLSLVREPRRPQN